MLERLVAAGLGTVNLSVDSVVAGFDVSGKELPKASDVLDALLKERQKNGLIVILNCVITKKNIKQVPTMLDFCNSKKVMMATIFAQNPNPNRKTTNPSYLEELLFKNTDQKEVVQMADYLISKKKEGYRLLEPIQYYEAVKRWVEGKLRWECDGGKYTLEIDTDGKIGICGYLPYLNIDLDSAKSNFYEEVKKFRETNQKWCTEKCLPSCMFCSSFYRQNPFAFLYSRIRYS